MRSLPKEGEQDAAEKCDDDGEKQRELIERGIGRHHFDGTDTTPLDAAYAPMSNGVVLSVPATS